MGYDLHIHRADQWLDAAGNPIAEDEWLALVEVEPTLKPRGSYGAAPLFVLGGGYSPSLYLEDGEITVTGALETETIRALVMLARKLDARVQGDDGEFYGATGQSIGYDPDAPERQDASAPRGLFHRFRRR